MLDKTRVLVLFAQEWDRLALADPALTDRYEFIHRGFDLFEFPENARLLTLDARRYVERMVRLAQRLGERFDESWWQTQLELSFLASFLMFASFKAWFGTHHQDEACRIRQRAIFPWCSEHVRTWAKWLSW